MMKVNNNFLVIVLAIANFFISDFSRAAGFPRLTQAYPQDAQLVTVMQAANLQQMLDTFGVIRLQIGDYSQSPPITLRSNQRIYGLGFSSSASTILPEVTVEPGTTGAVLANVRFRDGLVFPASDEVTRHNLFFEVGGKIFVNGATLEENTILGLENGNLSLIHI